MSLTFYDADVPQKRQEYASLVSSAGHIIFESHQVLHTRILNPNIKYAHNQPGEWIHTKYRFVSGREPARERAQLGQAIGHLTRVIDHSSPTSVWWVRYDLYYVVYELRMSGWRLRIIEKALTHVERQSQGLHAQITVLSKMLHVLRQCGESR